LRSHPAFGLIWPLLNRKILGLGLLRLRFCSIFATKAVSKPGAIRKRLICGQALSAKNSVSSGGLRMLETAHPELKTWQPTGGGFTEMGCIADTYNVLATL